MLPSHNQNQQEFGKGKKSDHLDIPQSRHILTHQEDSIYRM